MGSTAEKYSSTAVRINEHEPSYGNEKGKKRGGYKRREIELRTQRPAILLN